MHSNHGQVAIQPSNIFLNVNPTPQGCDLALSKPSQGKASSLLHRNSDTV